MCGFAGLVRFDEQPVPRQRLDRMARHLRHRGPDGEGAYAGGRCGLVCTQLTIIDRLGGAQPMSIPRGDGRDGEFVLVFNGEIYNHAELRRKLERLGRSFHSDHSDTEVIAQGYAAFGDDVAKHLHGMFAFAIWDTAAKRLTLCRDRAGEKPLYVHESREGLAFASLPATLLAGGVATDLDPAALVTFLRYGHSLERSLIAGVRELEPGCLASIGPDGRWTTRRYWRPPPVSRTSTSIGVVDATRELLEESIEARLQADVPLGCFLDGGIGASLCAALAQRKLGERGEPPLKTFSLDLGGRDGAPDPARLVAERLGTEHHTLPCDPGATLLEDLDRLTAVAGDPVGGKGVLPILWLSRGARPMVKTVLAGDGDDELFGGRDEYRALRMIQRMGPMLRLLPGGEASDPGERGGWGRVARLRGAARAPGVAAQYLSLVRLFREGDVRALGLDVDAGIDLASLWPDEEDPVKAAMLFDKQHWLPHARLRRVDHASMCVAMEVRLPMLDTPLLDLAGHLPGAVLMPGGRPGAVLRRLLEQLGLGGVAKASRPPLPPIGEWFRGKLHEPLRQRLLDGDLASLWVRQEPVERLLQSHAAAEADHTDRLMALASLSAWARWRRDPAPPPVWAPADSPDGAGRGVSAAS